jgi:hypothetical protein
MRMLVAAAVAAVLSSCPVMAADFSPQYDVTGSSPGAAGQYAGTVSIRQTGEAIYQVEWSIAGQTFVGTGIGGPTGLAVAYKSGADTGIAIYRQGQGGAVEGFWTYAGGKQMGRETWAPK